MAIINTPTPITTLTNVIFVNSPKHLVFSHQYIKYVVVRLWIWDGSVTKPSTLALPPTYTLTKYKVSEDDTDIIIGIDEFIRPYINPGIIYSPTASTISNSGVYIQYEIDMVYDDPINGDTLVELLYPTKFATLGYNWHYEGEQTFTYNRGSYGFVDTQIEKKYMNLNYFDYKIQLSGATTSDNMVVGEPVTINSSNVICPKEKYIILYLNKLGLWDTFTPSGKVIVQTKLNRDTYNTCVRNPLQSNINLVHSTRLSNIDTLQSYSMNTGPMAEETGQLIEEILNSSSTYIITWNGDTNEYSQIPVVVTDTNFVRKTRLNNKNKINYTLVFDEANKKINNIR